MSSLDKLYGRVSSRQFLIYGALLCLIGDVVYMAYIYGRFTDRQIYIEAVNQLLIHMPQAEVLMDPEIQEQVFTLMVRNLQIMIALVLVFHSIMYFLFIGRKRVALFYVKLLSWVALVGTIFMGLGYPLFLVLVPAYLYVALGLGYFSGDLKARRSPSVD